VKIHVEVLWVMSLCIVMVGDQCFRWPCCLHLKSYYPTTILHGVTTHKTMTWITTSCLLS